MSKKYICIHGHFYQPPRENAWLEVIEHQDSAYPFHDWNERINYECYGPNRASRILDDKDNIISISNNYSKMSFNFGPTLLHWMKEHAKEDYKGLVQADIESAKRFGGHSSAMAQVYNHIIMPLANRRDKETQVKWGIRDFEERFGHKPEGIWLAETAVDTETLEVLVENGILFTVLAPRQAHQVKYNNSGDWVDVSGERIDCRKPYWCYLPSGKRIALFFYDGGISQDIAFKGLLINGKEFAQRLVSAFDYTSSEPQLVHVATDGESYGHHHRHGDMALAYCLNYLENLPDVELINYGQFLELHPPKDAVKIYEQSSWSCVHGVERWRADCGCNSGMNGGWHQRWRAPLRNSLDWLRDQLKVIFEKEMSRYCADPWAARNDYIEVVLNRSEESELAFFKKHLKVQPTGDFVTKVIRMFEMQRHAMLMYTSCGWFFDEISGIETTQILQYADRAIQLAESESSILLEKEFLKRLQEAPSNLKELQNGALVHKKYVQPSRLTLSKVGSHYAVASLFDDFPEDIVICNYRAESEKYERLEAGAFRLAIGKTKVHSIITHSVKQFFFAVVYLGQNHIIGNSSNFMDDNQFEEMRKELSQSFMSSNISEVIGIMQTYFGPEKFSLWSLFKDEQRKVLDSIVSKDLQQAEESYKIIFNRNYSLMNVLKEAELPIPRVLLANQEVVLNAEIRNFFENGSMYPAKLEKLAEDVLKWEIQLQHTEIAYSAELKLFEVIKQLKFDASDVKVLETLVRVIKVLNKLRVELDLWEFQNEYYQFAAKLEQMALNGNLPENPKSRQFYELFNQLGELIKVKTKLESLI